MEQTLEEAKKNVLFMESLQNHPENILKLLDGSVKKTPNLDTITIDGKTTKDILCSYLEGLPEFNHCKISSRSWQTFDVNFKYLQFGEHARETSVIITFNIHDKTYIVCDSAINQYNEYMAPIKEFKEKELDEFWEDLDNMSFKKWKKNIRKCWKTKNTIFNKLSNTIFYTLFAPFLWKDRVKKEVDYKKECLKRYNEQAEKDYKRAVERQNILKSQFPEYEKSVLEKQSMISKFFDKYGYAKEKETWAVNW